MTMLINADAIARADALAARGVTPVREGYMTHDEIIRSADTELGRSRSVSSRSTATDWMRRGSGNAGTARKTAGKTVRTRTPPTAVPWTGTAFDADRPTPHRRTPHRSAVRSRR